ncbi:MAG TPA: type II toxin-antitoxin system VapC family toxin, partial [Stellaceae bacterium]|nr:type II toxin-antitoxin system VapC family toxin [Stellaceae bacterium]
LDASALLALLLGEPGSGKVRTALAQSALSTVNLAEVVGHFARNGSAEAEIRAVLDGLPMDVIGFDDQLAHATGLLLPATRRAGLSIGDRACLALALRLGVPALTADRSWQTVAAAVGVEIDLIR